MCLAILVPKHQRDYANNSKNQSIRKLSNNAKPIHILQTTICLLINQIHFASQEI